MRKNIFKNMMCYALSFVMAFSSVPTSFAGAEELGSEMEMSVDAFAEDVAEPEMESLPAEVVSDPETEAGTDVQEKAAVQTETEEAAAVETQPEANSEAQSETATEEKAETESEAVKTKTVTTQTEKLLSNDNADLETESVWEATIPQNLTGKWSEDLLNVAKSQLGYRESSTNYRVRLSDGSLAVPKEVTTTSQTVEVDAGLLDIEQETEAPKIEGTILSETVSEDGKTKVVVSNPNGDSKRKGWTRYGEMYGAPYEDWCAMFVSFCLYYAKIPVSYMPRDSYCPAWVEKLQEMEMFTNSRSYIPQSGDIIFFDWKSDGETDHVGIVEYFDPETNVVHTIEGNSGDSVRRNEYDLTSSVIYGYGILPENPDYVDPNEKKEVKESEAEVVPETEAESVSEQDETEAEELGEMISVRPKEDSELEETGDEQVVIYQDLLTSGLPEELNSSYEVDQNDGMHIVYLENSSYGEIKLAENKSFEAGESVEFNIVPADGYTITECRIMPAHDEDGAVHADDREVIDPDYYTVSSYGIVNVHFTMPESNVAITIEGVEEDDMLSSYVPYSLNASYVSNDSSKLPYNGTSGIVFNGNTSPFNYYPDNFWTGLGFLGTGTKSFTFTTVDGVTHSGVIGYCIQSSWNVPDNGRKDYGTTFSNNSDYYRTLLGKALFYLYVGPAWGKSIKGTDGVTRNFRSIFNSNGVTDEEGYYSMSHIILSYIYWKECGNPGNWSWYQNEYGVDVINAAGRNFTYSIVDQIAKMPNPTGTHSLNPDTVSNNVSNWVRSYNTDQNGSKTWWIRTVKPIVYSTPIPENTITITVPANAKIYNATQGTSAYGGQTMTVYGGDELTFFFKPALFGTTQTITTSNQSIYTYVQAYETYDQYYYNQDLGLVYSEKKNFTLRFNIPIEGTLDKRETGKAADVNLTGAVFEVYSGSSATGTPVTSFTMTSDPMTFILPAKGTYTFKEIKAPNGYDVSTTTITKTFSGVSGSSNTFTFNNSPSSHAKLIVYKYDSTLNKRVPVRNMEFRIRTSNSTADNSNLLKLAEEGQTTPHYNFKTNSEGFITFNDFPVGGYYLEEVKAPQGYLLNGQLKFFRVENAAAGTVVEVELDDRPLYSKLAVRKVDKNGRSLGAGFNFNIRCAEDIVAVDGSVYSTETGADVTRTKGTSIGSATTDASGLATFPSSLVLFPGRYELREIYSADGYQAYPDVMYFEVARDGKITFDDPVLNASLSSVETDPVDGYTTGVILSYTVKVPNETSEFTLYKKTTNGAALSGVKFSIGPKNGTKKTYTTNSSGMITLSGTELKHNTVYEIQETSVPSGYVLDPTVHTFVVGSNGLIGTNYTNNSTYGGYVVSDGMNPYSITLTNSETFATDVKVQKKNSTGSTNLGSGFTFAIFADENIKDKSGKTYPYMNKGDRVAEQSTNSSGVATFTRQLYPGKYHIEETAAPDGYTVSKVKKTFTVTSSGSITWGDSSGSGKTVTFNDTQTKLVINKTDASTHGPLAGIKFRIKEQGVANSSSQIYTTDTNGKITIEGSTLKHGKTYTIQETETLSGYKLDSTVTTFTVDENGYINGSDTYTVNRTNAKDISTTLIINKKDSVSGNALSGITFRIKERGTSDAASQLHNTDSNGKITITGTTLAPGKTYTVQETATLPGYILDNTVTTFTVDANGKINGSDTYTVNRTNTKRSTTVSLTKKDTNGRTLGAGFTFALYTNANIVDGAGKTYSGYANGTLLETKTTTSTGTVAFTKALYPGKYYVVETAAADGYILDPTHRTFTVSDSGTISWGAGFNATPENEVTTLIINKTDSVSGNVLAGIKFRIKEEGAADATSQIYTTDSTGKITVSGSPLKHGKTYTIQETETLPGYKLDSTVTKFTVDATGKINGSATHTVNRTNTKNSTTVTINKKDSNGAALGTGFTFALYTNANIVDGAGKTYSGYANGTLLETKSTTSSGSVVFTKALYPGKYYVVETAAADGYVVDSTHRTFTVTPAGTITWDSGFNANVPNKTTTLIINKKDSVTGNVLSGIKFRIARKNTSYSASQVYTTDGNGQIIISGSTFRHGLTYTIEEKETLPGYDLDTTVTEFTVDANGKINGSDTYTVNRTNTKKSTTLTLTKKDSKNVTLGAGFTFKLYANENIVDGSGATFSGYAKDALLETKSTTTSGTAVFTKALYPGKYYVVETASADGYVLDSTKRTFTVTTAGAIAWDTGFSANVPNESTTVVIHKTDAKSGAALQGVKFRIKEQGAANNNSQIFTTDKDGNITIEGSYLKHNTTYEIQETQSISDYILDSTVSTFKVDANGKINGSSIYTFNKTNSKEVITTLAINKKDSVTGSALQGIKFRIKEQGAADAANQIHSTDANGQIVLTGTALKKSTTYTIQETETLPGYILDSTVTTFTVDGEGKVNGSATYTVNRTNTKKSTTVTLTKKDTKNRTLGTGFTYALYANENIVDGAGSVYTGYNNGSLLQSASTTSAGSIAFTKALYPGKYYVVETAAPNGYVIDTTKHTFTVSDAGAISWGAGFSAVVTDDETSVTINKTDSVSGSKLAGIKFRIKKSGAADAATQIYTTDTNGQINLSGSVLEHNTTFMVQETETLPGYTLDSTVTSFTVDKNGLINGSSSHTINRTNAMKSTTVTIQKKDEKSNNAGTGFTFRLYANEAITDGAGKTYTGYTKDAMLQSVDTDSTGKAAFTKALYPGKYYILEYAAPDGFVRDTAKHTFTVTNTGTIAWDAGFSSTVQNDYTTLIINKTDLNTGAVIPGVKFRIKEQGAADAASQIYTTDVNGKITIEGNYLKHGKTYTIQETQAVGEYILDPTVTTFTVDENGKINGSDTYTVNRTNSKEVVTTLVINKKDSVSGSVLEGIKFRIKEQGTADAANQIHPTDANGKIVLSGTALKHGKTYTIQETETLAGYILDPTVTTFTVDAEGKINGSDTLTVNRTNTRKTTTVTLTKKDSKGATLGEGFTFKLYTNANIVDGAGATYSGYANGTLLETKSTTSSGSVVFTKALYPGKYYVVETASADGYVLDGTHRTFTVSTNGEITWDSGFSADVPNSPTTLVINKTDAVSGSALAGIKFRIKEQGAADAASQIYTTTATGKITIEGSALKHGKTYTIQETETLAGYNLDPAVTTFSVDAEGKINGSNSFTVNRTNSKKTTTVTLTKKDSKGATLGSGFTFSLYTNDNIIDGAGKTYSGYANGTLLETKSSASNGSVTFTKALYPGKYYVVETASADGYVLDGTHRTFTVTAAGTIAWDTGFSANVPNNPTTLIINKTDASNGNPLAGIKFRIKEQGTADAASQIYPTDANGKITISGSALKHGKTYTIQETETLTGYKLDSTVTTFSVDAEGKINGSDTYTVNRTNAREVETTLIINKKDSVSGSVLAGIKFRVKEKGTADAASQIHPTDANGKITISGTALAPGKTYTIQETETLAGYVLDPTVTEFTIDASGYVNGSDTYTVNRTNTRKSAHVTIQKQDVNGSALGTGFTFDLYADADIKDGTGKVYSGYTNGTKLESKDTDSTGKAAFTKDLYPGKYHVEETKAADGYILDTTKRTFTVSENGEIVWDAGCSEIVKNESTKLVVQKTNTDGTPLANAVFRIKEQGTSDNANQLHTTTAEGKIEVTGLKHNATYVITEVSAPDLYVTDSTEHTFRVDEKGLINGQKSYTYTKQNKPTTYVLHKNDEKKTPLSGVQFRLKERGAADAANQIFTTDTNGEITFTGLKHNTVYELTEVLAPNFYYTSTNVITFTVDANGKINGKEKEETTVENAQTAFILTKKSAGGELLPGAQYRIKPQGTADSNDQIYTTNNKGVINITKLNHNTVYEVKEVKAPDGYTLDSTVRTFTVDEKGRISNNQTYSLELIDTPVEITLTKVSSEDDSVLIPGASYRVKEQGADDSTGTIYTTKADGTITMTGLIVGKTYVLKEVTAPEGYSLNPNESTFTVADDGTVDTTGLAKVTVKDNPTTLILKKVDSADKGLKKAKFRIKEQGTADNDNQLHETDEKGIITIKGLKHSTTYEVTEVTAPDGYSLDTETRTFTVDANGFIGETDSYELKVVNTPRVLKIRKIDKITGKDIPGAELILKDEKGAKVESWISDGEKAHEISGIKKGKYTLEETKAPDKYEKAEPIEFTVEDGSEDIEITMEDVPLGSVKIIKYSSDGNTPLAGVSYHLEGGDSVSMDLTTGADGVALFDKLKAGTYTITETKTVEGMTLLAEPIEVTIPVVLTELEAANADKTNARFKEDDGTYYYYDVTYEVTDSAHFAMPMSGSNGTWTLGYIGMGILGLIGVWFVIRKRKMLMA